MYQSTYHSPWAILAIPGDHPSQQLHCSGFILDYDTTAHRALVQLFRGNWRQEAGTPKWVSSFAILRTFKAEPNFRTLKEATKQAKAKLKTAAKKLKEEA